MRIDESDEQFENAATPMDASSESDSNVTIERDWQPRKHLRPIRATEEGMQIDESESQR
jgi:hypothetical protein